ERSGGSPERAKNCLRCLVRAHPARLHRLGRYRPAAPGGHHGLPPGGTQEDAGARSATAIVVGQEDEKPQENRRRAASAAARVALTSFCLSARSDSAQRRKAMRK